VISNTLNEFALYWLFLIQLYGLFHFRTERNQEEIMAMLEDRIEIGNPTQPHCATVLLLDTSGSMDGPKIAQLNDALRTFRDETAADELARKRVDLAIITFGGSVETVQNFSSIEQFEPSTLSASGGTPMGEAILKASDLIEQRKQQYKSQGIDYYRPWMFLITDGSPTDMSPGDPTWKEVVKRVREGEASKKFMFFAVAVEPADLEILAQIAPPSRPPVKLIGSKFKEMFQWLSKSQARVSSSRVGENVSIENPVAAGWGEVAA
jgi:uncharacterized protein YegL